MPTKTLTVTQQEQEILNAIANSEYHDGSDPIGHTVWGGFTYLCKSSHRSDGAKVTKKGLGGIMASLQAKGFVRVDEDHCEGVDKDVRPSSQVTLLEAARPFIKKKE